MTNHDTFAQRFLTEAKAVIDRLDAASIERAASLLAQTRAAGGRLFILGVGGSAANASHAVNDFRKIAGIEAYAPTDNVSELTARINDEGWEGAFAEWLKVSRLSKNDALLITNLLKWIRAVTNDALITWAIEDGRGFARRLADGLLLAGHEVVWVPSRLTAAHRKLHAATRLLSI